MFPKILLLVAVAIFGAIASPDLSDEQKELMLAIHNECMKTTGATDEMAANAMAGTFSEDPAFKEHLFCAAKKTGFMSDSGELQTNIIKEKIMMVVNDEAKADEFTKMCAVPKGTPQETAFDMIKCLHKAKHGGK